MTRCTLPRTVRELLDQEEARALQRLVGTAQRMGEDLCLETDLRRRIRTHPLLATGLGALAGFLASQLVPMATRRVLTASSAAVLLRALTGDEER